MINFLSIVSNSTGKDSGLPLFCPIVIRISSLFLLLAESSLRYFGIHARAVLSVNFVNSFTNFAMARAGPCVFPYLAIMSLSFWLYTVRFVGFPAPVALTISSTTRASLASDKPESKATDIEEASATTFLGLLLVTVPFFVKKFKMLLFVVFVVVSLKR